MKQDLKNNLSIFLSIAPSARTASVNGSGVDVGFYQGVLVTITPGAITDGTHTPRVQESDDNAAFTDVAAGDLIGTLSPLVTNTVQRVGYTGRKRYIRVVFTVAGATTGGLYSAVVILGNGRKFPQ